MLRQIITIDEDKCDGCGLCIPGCKEGALQIIDGKCRLVGDLFCDGLGACIGECPHGAISIIEREAEPYNESIVMMEMIKQPKAVLKAHLLHLKEHNAVDFLDEAVSFMKENGIENPLEQKTELKTLNIHHHNHGGGCPGSAMRELKRNDETKENTSNSARQTSELAQWPVQLHLVSPSSPFFKNKELVIMSTCGPLASANVHQDYIKGRAVVVACPKLDKTEPYTEKLAAIYAASGTEKVIVVRIEVPCCGGLSRFAFDAAHISGRTGITVEEHILSVEGNLKSQNILFKN